MKITRSLALSFGLILLLFGLNVGIQFWASAEKSDSLAALRRAAEGRMRLRSIEHDLRDRRRESAILSEALLDRSQLAPLRERLDALVRRPVELVAALDRQDVDELRRAIDQFVEAAASVFEAAASGRTAEARLAQQRSDLAADEALAVIERVARAEETQGAAAADRFFANTLLTHQVSLVTLGLSLLVTIVVGTLVAWMVRMGFDRLRRGTERIAQGDLEHRMELGVRDEFGELAHAFNVMSGQLLRAMTDARESRAAAERASRAKSTFLANMSHEFRTPLTSILCYADLLREEAARLGQPRLVQDAGEVRQAAEHLVALVTQVVDLSRIEAGRLSVTIEEVDLRALVDRLHRTVLPLAARNGNTLHVAVSEDVDLMVVDALKLRQILLNLVANACKFTSNGAVSLLVQRAALDGAAAVSFRVVDTGIGMTPEQAARIFEEFEQGDASIERGYGGSGLGLAISKGLCTLLGGRIDVTSEPGAGTTFTMLLPSTPLAAASYDARNPTAA